MTIRVDLWYRPTTWRHQCSWWYRTVPEFMEIAYPKWHGKCWYCVAIGMCEFI